MSLTFDQMHADVARALDLTPAELGAQDNLYDLGLDSMRLMTLAMEWQEQGADLDFGLLLESQTLADWWAALEAQRQSA
ncbi:phosphopantetheine-binding protein [Paenirhodobacter populi]|uniref:Phosphopantetheine-binding protein n=1 Tax=Paenirhodobacter populi TaxID=2306993 RepID=A0A443IQZ9_9RHOB|nr:phosphopantetheine-binding protein [Sinirhodobacter populi]RWR08918.1 phosphopantetheine-binding protein [Sinirhodobacter populi]